MFFERCPATRQRLPHILPPRPRVDAHMHMWGQLFPNRGQSEWPCSPVGKEVYDLLARVDHHVVLKHILYPYAGIDRRMVHLVMHVAVN